MDTEHEILLSLNAGTKDERIKALRSLMALYRDGSLARPATGENVNNHIHTIYSFSPYSPTAAAYMAWKNGLATAGIMDHDSVAGAEEFIEAGRIIGIAVTVGFELRCSFAGTPFEGKRINNPDQVSVGYLAMHGIPHDMLGIAEKFLEPYREKRNIRNRAMTARLNGIIAPSGIALDFDKDILPLSQSAGGGSVTERHILYALAGKIIECAEPGQLLVTFLEEKLGLTVSGSNREKLVNPNDEYYRYYLLGQLKGGFVERFYIPATDELPGYRDFIGLAEKLCAIPAYAYLGDVGDSVTGDKKTQAFEDSYLDELVAFLKNAGFKAITYMPTRNTGAQLERLMALCERHGLFQICGEDINSPFQSFVCKALERPEFGHLISAAWALIGHENAATASKSDGMFSHETALALPGIDERVERYAALGKKYFAEGQGDHHEN